MLEIDPPEEEFVEVNFKPKMVCPCCRGNKAYSTEAGFRRHWRTLHIKRLLKEVCPECSTRFKNHTDLKLHLVKRHSMAVDSSTYYACLAKASREWADNREYKDPGQWRYTPGEDADSKPSPNGSERQGVSDTQEGQKKQSVDEQEHAVSEAKEEWSDRERGRARKKKRPLSSSSSSTPSLSPARDPRKAGKRTPRVVLARLSWPEPLGNMGLAVPEEEAVITSPDNADRKPQPSAGTPTAGAHSPVVAGISSDSFFIPAEVRSYDPLRQPPATPLGLSKAILELRALADRCDKARRHFEKLLASISPRDTVRDREAEELRRENRELARKLAAAERRLLVHK